MPNDAFEITGIEKPDIFDALAMLKGIVGMGEVVVVNVVGGGIEPLSEELELQIREDYFRYLTAAPYYEPSDESVDGVFITRYVNTYKNGVALFIRADGWAYPEHIEYVCIGGYHFAYCGTRQPLFYSFATTEFILFDVAYERGLLTHGELSDWMSRLVGSEICTNNQYYCKNS
ncbi:MAG: hypothetical protein FWH07_02685, partial [Oscillospiraceae bacterium]|nr:hypothetical protein [Oscillospiraceae bacterium]